MKTVFVSIGVALLILVGIVGYLLGLEKSKDNPVGSVAIGTSYQATTTIPTTVAGTYLIKSGSGVLGSIVVASSSSSIFSVKDANITGAATSTMVILKGAIGEGTYTFDMNFYNGLYITIPTNFIGEYITTYR
jgi:hypothetical protein